MISRSSNIIESEGTWHDAAFQVSRLGQLERGPSGHQQVVFIIAAAAAVDGDGGDS